MKLTFWGAAQQVTGSMYLLEVEDIKILIDCGMDIGRERGGDVSEPPFPPAYPGAVFPFDASTVSAVLLTHAHIDHSGMLPNLFREGFQGEIYATSATRDLTQILLYDSASLHRRKLKKASFVDDKRGKKKAEEVKAAGATYDKNILYLEESVDETMEYFSVAPLDKQITIADGIKVTYVTAGHLLGAASLYIEVLEEGKELVRVGFSGDLGRKNYPLLPDPKPFPEVDYLICESTYGNRSHVATADPVDIMADIIQKTCVDIPGRLIIPAFSVGRTQAILYTLNKLYTERGFDPIKVFSDSPMALLSTKVYSKYHNLLNKEAQDFYHKGKTLFDFENFEFVSDPEKSKALSDYSEPSIIISSSGMIKGGRIEYHVKKNLENAYATIFIVGFAPEGTLSHSLVNGLEIVKNDGKEYKVRATIEKTDIFSGHADQAGLKEFINQQDAKKLRKLFFVHGDLPAMNGLRDNMAAEGYNAVMPSVGDVFELA